MDMENSHSSQPEEMLFFISIDMSYKDNTYSGMNYIFHFMLEENNK